MSANPVTIARFTTMRRIREGDTSARKLPQRRANLRKHGVTSPLTRAELAHRVAGAN